MNVGSSISTSELIASRIVIRGLVQGVGMRPAIARLAQQLLIAGYVANDGNGVEVYVEGTGEQLKQFERQLANCFPAEARVISIELSPTAIEYVRRFLIRSSDLVKDAVATAVPQDKAVCASCLRNVQHENDRRFAYPFTTCTDCGPRYSITGSMPFDRATTTMGEFPPCAECEEEFRSADDRRFHAQTIACAECGPHLTFTDGESQETSSNGDAIQQASAAIRAGRIVTVKGVGGYQLVCDATSSLAVDRLRERKQRRRKPLAVMVSTLEQAEQLAELGDRER